MKCSFEPARQDFGLECRKWANLPSAFLYQSSKSENLRYNQTFTDERLITNKIDMPDYNEKNMKSQAIQGEYERYIGYIMLKDEIFLDQKNKKHILTKETQEQWLKTFELENLEQSYIPKHSKEIKEALGGKEIRLTKGSLLKIVSKQREQYIPQVKETLDNPDFILKDIDDMVILAKKIGDKQYFTSINLETEDFLISVSNAPKKENVLKNKVENEAKIVYQSPNSESIFYTPELLQTSQSLANKIDMPDYNEKNMKSQATQGEKTMDMLRQEYKEKDIDKEKEFNRDKINRFGGKNK